MFSKKPELHRLPTSTQSSPISHPPGANSVLGIGRASAHQFAEHGARAVYLCDYDDTHLAAHQREIAGLWPQVDVHTRQFDAADEKAVKGVIDEALAKYGRLDVFFANAGTTGPHLPFGQIEADEFMDVLRVNSLRCVFPCLCTFPFSSSVSH